MKGLQAFLPFLAMLACMAALASLQDGSEAGTTYIDGNWNIAEDTILENGTWWVNGSIEVVAGTFVLDHAELVVNGSEMDNALIVDIGASLLAKDSRIRGGSFGVGMVVNGRAELLDCTLTNPPRNHNECFVWVDRGSVSMERCLIENCSRLVDAYSRLTMRECRLSKFTTSALHWRIDPQGTTDGTVLIEDTDVQGGGSGTGISLWGMMSMGWGGIDITVRNCTIDDCDTGMAVYYLEEDERVRIEGNVASGCRRGIVLVDDGPLVSMRSNSWCCDHDGIAMYLDAPDYGAPSVERDRLLGEGAGLKLHGEGQAMAMAGLFVDCGAIGLDCSDVYLTVNDSVIEAASLDVRFDGYGWVHLRNCTSDREGQVLSDRGEIAEYADLLVESVSWQEGTPITSGAISLYNATGHVVGTIDLPVPRALRMTTWLLTLRSETELTEARAYHVADGLPFFGDFIPIRQGAFSHILIYDRSAPSVSISSPTNDERLGRAVIVVCGGLYERGAGMGTVEVRLDGGEWAPVQVMTEYEWSTVLDRVGDGVHDIEARATDRAGNSADVLVHDIVMDATEPIIEVLQPGQWTNHSPAMLVGQTEVGARVTINGESTTVDSNGIFKKWVGLHDGPNDFEIDAIDETGNANATVCTITLDTEPPRIFVESPPNGSWSWSTSIVVRGRTDEVARVTVNGEEASIGEFLFNAVVDGTEGPVSIDIAAVDRAMNVNVTGIVVNVDQTPPVIDVASPVDGLVTATRRIVVVGTVSDIGAVVLTLQDGHVQSGGGVWQSSIDLVEGWNTITVTAEDAAGNRASRTLRVLLDTRPPTLRAEVAPGQVVLPGLAGTSITGQRVVRVLVKVDERGVVRVTGMPDVEVPAGESEVHARLSPGRNCIAVNFTDLAGNRATGVVFEIVLDVVPPEVHVTSPADGARVTGAPLYVVGWTEPYATVTVNGEEAVVNATGGFWALIYIDMGAAAVNVTAADRFGNAANVTILVHRVERPPEPRDGTRAGLPAAAGLLIAVMAVLVLLLARTRGRRRPDVSQRGEGGPPNDPVQSPDGTAVRIRRGR